MRAFVLDHVSDDRLLADLAILVATDRHTTAALLAHLGEVEQRGLYLPAACSSMFVYATRVLGFSENAAFKRIRAARVARRFPAVLEAVADGRMHLSSVVMLGPHMTAKNVEAIVEAAAHQTKAELEVLVARLAPRPDLPASIAPIAETGRLALEPPPAGGAEGRLAPEPPPARGATRTKALSPGRYGLQVTIGQATQDKLMRAQALLRHRNPGGELEEVIDRALDALLVVLEKEKFGKTSRPRAAKARARDADPRSVPNAVKRAVHARDGEQCAFVSADGVRCTERGFLELDHVTMACRGGQPTADGTRWLCDAHNRYEAERQLGAAFVREKRARKRRQREGDGARAAAAPSALAEPVADGMDAGSRREEVGAARGQPDARPGGPARREEVDREVTLALRSMGFGAGETRRAMADSAQVEGDTFDARLRAALAAWRTANGSRCSEGAFDATAYWPVASPGRYERSSIRMSP